MNWPDGTKIELNVINMIANPGGTIQHVGVGYFVVLPDGTTVPRGYTWTPNHGQATALKAILSAFHDDMAASEGLTVADLAPKSGKLG